VYNVEKYLQRCIDSILAQSYSDFHLLLIDDGSPDSCGIICDNYAKLDERITVFHQTNTGVSAARNLGIEWTLNKPEVQWLTFIDSDDWVHPLYLESLLHAAEYWNVKISQVGVMETDESLPYSNITSSVSVKKTSGAAYRTYGVCPWGKLFHSSLLKNVRFPVGIRHEDEFVTYQILFSQDYVAHNDNLMYYYFKRSDSFMHTQWSPEHLSLLDAREQQLSYFSKRNLQNEYAYIYSYYLKDLIDASKQISQSQLENRTNYIKDIQRRTRRAIREHAPAPKPTIRNNPQVYEVAYPKLMYVYWQFKGIIGKIRRMLGNS
jgi:glycosyltransferase involved in cell wall biosynthesis